MPGGPRVLLVCPGLEHAHRGFETFARECFDALRGRDDLMVGLVKGSGARAPGEARVPTLTRDTALARRLARMRSVEPFIIEHLTFSAAVIPLLSLVRPDVVYFSEWHVGRVLALWRRASAQPFKLVLCNGALAPGGYAHLDLVQQLVPGAIEYTATRGESTSNQEFLPLAASVGQVPTLLTGDSRAQLRESLHLPLARQIVLSAGAINTQKRMDYVVEEIASMPSPRPYLVLLGQQESETPLIRDLAMNLLGEDGHTIRTIDPRSVPAYYRAADAFVLASLWESFGRVLVEAQSHGLPCLAHDHPVMRWVLGDEGDTLDLRQPGQIVTWLRGLGPDDCSSETRCRRQRLAYERFSWDVLADRYAEMLRATVCRAGH